MPEFMLALKDRKEVAKDTMAFWFDTAGSGYAFRAGQNADFTLVEGPADAQGHARTFSFASSPSHKDAFMVATRMRSTPFKNALKQLALGTKLKVTGPMGSFTLHKDSAKPAVFVAGGIGITPMRSILESAFEQNLPHQLYLFYSNHESAGTAFLEEFETWAKQHKNFKFIPTLTKSADASWAYERGRLNPEKFRRHLTDLEKPIYYLAGPPEMVAAVREMLEGLGVSEDNFKTEEFAGY